MEKAKAAGTPQALLDEASTLEFLQACVRRTPLDADLVIDACDAAEMNSLDAVTLGGGELSVAEAADKLYLLNKEAVLIIAACKNGCLRIGINFGDSSVYEPEDEVAQEGAPASKPEPVSQLEPVSKLTELKTPGQSNSRSPMPDQNGHGLHTPLDLTVCLLTAQQLDEYDDPDEHPHFPPASLPFQLLSAGFKAFGLKAVRTKAPASAPAKAASMSLASPRANSIGSISANTSAPNGFTPRAAAALLGNSSTPRLRKSIGSSHANGNTPQSRSVCSTTKPAAAAANGVRIGGPTPDKGETPPAANVKAVTQGGKDQPAKPRRESATAPTMPTYVPSYARQTISLKAKHEQEDDTCSAAGMTPPPTLSTPSLYKTVSAPPLYKTVSHCQRESPLPPKKPAPNTVFDSISSSLLKPTKAFLAWSKKEEDPDRQGLHDSLALKTSQALKMSHAAAGPICGSNRNLRPVPPLVRHRTVSELRAAKASGQPLTTEEMQSIKAQEESGGSFKARPMPKFISKSPSTPAANETPPLTTEKMQCLKAQEESDGSFKARPMPKFISKSPAPPAANGTPPLTTEEMQYLKALEESGGSFKARPMPKYISKSPTSPATNGVPPLTTEELQCLKAQEESGGSFKARPMPKFISKSPVTPATNGTVSGTPTSRHSAPSIPLPSFSKSQGNGTCSTPQPFRLASTERHQKAQEEFARKVEERRQEDASMTKPFKATPLPVQRKSTPPQQFTSNSGPAARTPMSPAFV